MAFRASEDLVRRRKQVVWFVEHCPHLTYEEIGAKFGFAKGSITHILQQYGVPGRGKGWGATRPRTVAQRRTLARGHQVLAAQHNRKRCCLPKTDADPEPVLYRCACGGVSEGQPQHERCRKPAEDWVWHERSVA